MEEDIWEKAMNEAAKIMQNREWVKWVHEGTNPATTNFRKTLNTVINRGKHCAMCLNINGCCFPKNSMPQYPLHPHCHCSLSLLVQYRQKSNASKRNFQNTYSAKIKIKKKVLFESWGYDILDSQWLRHEFERQAKEKYERGEFELNKLNNYGQRINIQIILPRKDKMETVKFVSGWMVYPNGNLKLTTPMGGWL